MWTHNQIKREVRVSLCKTMLRLAASPEFSEGNFIQHFIIRCPHCTLTNRLDKHISFPSLISFIPLQQ